MPTSNSTSRSILHYDAERIDYAVTESELRELAEGSNAVWKDICLASASLFLGSAPNAIGQFVGQGVFQLTAGLFLNSIVAGISFVSALAFGIAWRRAATNRKALLARIRNKPQVVLVAEVLQAEKSSEIGAVRAIAMPKSC